MSYQLLEMPERIQHATGGIDLFPNVWLSDDGDQLFCGVRVISHSLRSKAMC